MRQGVDTAINNEFERLTKKHNTLLDKPLETALDKSVADYKAATPPSRQNDSPEKMLQDIKDKFNANGGWIDGRTYQDYRPLWEP